MIRKLISKVSFYFGPLTYNPSILKGGFMFKSKSIWAMGLLLVAAFAFVASGLTADDQESIQAAQGKGAAKKLVPAYVPKTGATISYAPGDDGDLQKGLPWPEPRFIDNGDGTVTDKLTTLIWTLNAQAIPGQMDWYTALQACNDFVFAGYDDWRMPNVREMYSLVDYGTGHLALGNPFVNTGGAKWTSSGGGDAFFMAYDGRILTMGKTQSGILYIWPVRGGK
jgi:hypothetical protein